MNPYPPLKVHPNQRGRPYIPKSHLLLERKTLNLGRAPLTKRDFLGLSGPRGGPAKSAFFHMAAVENGRFVAQVSPKAFGASKWAFQIGLFFHMAAVENGRFVAQGSPRAFGASKWAF